MVGVRFLSLLAAVMARNNNDKFYKILKQSRPVVDTLVFQEGDVIPAQVKIPTKPASYPDYHYEALFFKRQNRGLYGGQQRKRSKTSSEAGNKNLRVHLPNVHKQTLWLSTLGEGITTRVSTKVLKTIDREGGLDNYLIKDKPARVKTLGALGWKLRYEVMKKQEVEEAKKINSAVKHVAQDGSLVTVGKKELLNMLYLTLREQSYTGLARGVFNRQYKDFSVGELVNKLRDVGADVSKVVV